MANILTPLSLWESFDKGFDTNPEKVSEIEQDGIIIERVRIDGRATGAGRVSIAAAYAYDKKSPATETVIIIPDSSKTIDENLLKMFVRRGYTALMVDYRGEWKDCDFYTQYPPNVDYANFAKCGRHYGFVDDSAKETSWYEWVAVGIYARKYAFERSGSKEIAVVGLRDGGEIAWKLGVAEEFECIVPVCAAGWRAYSGISKYTSVEPDLNEERYRFIAGIDSQAYAPYVRCPVLMLCTVNDPKFDYDRAHDTFSRINAKFINESAIAYAVQGNACIGEKCTADMFLFLDKNLKNRQVFIPKPSEVVVEVDDESNLVARVVLGDKGIVEDCGMYLAEDCIDSHMRDWTQCTKKIKKSSEEQEFYLNIYEKTTTVFVLCFVKYINGFTVYRLVAKKISGKFRNMQAKCRVMYSDADGIGGFVDANLADYATGGMFFTDSSLLPQVVEPTHGVKGLSSKGGLTTFRLNNPKYSPTAGNILKLDVFSQTTSVLTLSFSNGASGEVFSCDFDIVGGVWQNIIAESSFFKNVSGVSLAHFSANYKFSINSKAFFAVNNIMWL